MITKYILEISSIIFIFSFGALLHFVYKLSGNSKIAGIFSPVNESVWEHMKLFLWPSIAFSIIEICKLSGINASTFLSSKAISIFISILLCIIIYYSYTFFTKRSILLVDILSFLLSIIVGQHIGYKIITSDIKVDTLTGTFSGILILLLIFIFILFTYFPPHISLFKDPLDGTYGIQKRI